MITIDLSAFNLDTFTRIYVNFFLACGIIYLLEWFTSPRFTKLIVFRVINILLQTLKFALTVSFTAIFGFIYFIAVFGMLSPSQGNEIADVLLNLTIVFLIVLLAFRLGFVLLSHFSKSNSFDNQAWGFINDANWVITIMVMYLLYRFTADYFGVLLIIIVIRTFLVIRQDKLDDVYILVPKKEYELQTSRELLAEEEKKIINT